MPPHPPTAASNISELYRSLCEFIAEEARVQRDSFNRHLSRPLQERVEDERCLADLEFEGDVDLEKGTFAFRCSGRLGNTAQFREGDRLRIHRGDYHATGTDAVLVRESDRGIQIQPDEAGQLRSAVTTNASGWILDEGFFDAHTILRKGLDDAMDSDHGRERVMALFGGSAQPEIDFGLEGFDSALGYGEIAGLNETQAEALAQAFSSNHCYLIQGPPGTGKTYVLAQVVAGLVENGERVLLTAFTHRAIHHALRSCSKVIADPSRVAKIGVPVQDPTLESIRQFPSFSRSPFRDLFGGYVIGATPYSARSRRMAGVNFDTVIVDEASQMTVPLAVLALLQGKKFLFFGDHRQLPPVLMSVPKSIAGAWSVFGSLVRHSDYTTLTTTYRMNAELTRWPSGEFYGGELQAAAETRERQLVLPSGPASHPALVEASSLVCLHLPHRESRTTSREEAAAVASVIEDAVRCGLAPTEVGVVTPFRRQARLIKRRLRKSTVLPETATADITVDTVERFQGQERELVIVSMTASDPAFLERIGDFFFQAERLNVAATRARSKLIVVVSTALSEFEPASPDMETAVSRFIDFIDGCETVH